jgi:predicted neuraminidase
MYFAARRLKLLLVSALTIAAAGTPVSGGYRQGYVIPPGQIPANHGSSIIELNDATWLSCWYGGSYEKAADVRVLCSRLGKLGEKWTAPEVAVAAGEKAGNGWLTNGTLGNTALHLAEDGRLWLFYNATTLSRGWSATHVAYKTSADHGKSWSAQGTKITTWWGNSIKNAPLALGRNRMLLPLYHEFFGTYGYSCLVSADQGRLFDKRCAVIPGNNHLQPALVKLPGGRIAAYLRNVKKQTVLLSTLSPDLEHWSEPVAVNLPNPNAPVALIRMSEEKVLIVYNRSTVDRAVLSLAVSTDGSRFTWVRDLENGKEDFSYPAIIRGPNGFFHVVYTYRGRSAIKHVVFDESWLMGK